MKAQELGLARRPPVYLPRIHLKLDPIGPSIAHRAPDVEPSPTHQELRPVRPVVILVPDLEVPVQLVLLLIRLHLCQARLDVFHRRLQVVHTRTHRHEFRPELLDELLHAHQVHRADRRRHRRRRFARHIRLGDPLERLPLLPIGVADSLDRAQRERGRLIAGQPLPGPFTDRALRMPAYQPRLGQRLQLPILPVIRPQHRAVRPQAARPQQRRHDDEPHHPIPPRRAATHRSSSLRIQSLGFP